MLQVHASAGEEKELAPIVPALAGCATGPQAGGYCLEASTQPYKSGPSKFWLKTKNVVESELILLGTDYDNEGKPIAYLGREADGHLKFAGTAFVTLTDYKVYSYFAYTSRQLYIIDFVRQIPIS